MPYQQEPHNVQNSRTRVMDRADTGYRNAPTATQQTAMHQTTVRSRPAPQKSAKGGKKTANGKKTVKGKKRPNGAGAQKRVSSRPVPPPKKKPTLAQKRAKRDSARRRMQRFGARFFTFFVCFGILFLLSLGGLSLAVRGSAVSNPNIDYQVGDGKHIVVTRAVRQDKLYRDGILYLNMTELAEYCDWAVTGTAREIRFICQENDTDNVRFVLGTPIAYVNDCPIRLSGAVLYEDGNVLVPSEFITYYVNGLSWSVGEKTGKITVSRILDPDNQPTASVKDDGDEVVYLPVSFTLHSQIPCDRVEEPSVYPVP